MQSLRLKSFKQHCARRGFDLLQDDYRFIDRTLNSFGKGDFKAVLERYLEEWYLGMVEAPNDAQAQGIARKRANIWLLQYADEVKMKKMKERCEEKRGEAVM